MHNPTFVLKNETTKTLCDFDIRTDHQISARRPDVVIVIKKKRTWKIVDFAVSADHRVKLKKNKKKDKYIDLAGELEKNWNTKVMIISVVIGAIGTVTEGLEQGLEDVEIRGREENIQSTALLRSTSIWDESCRHEETFFLSSDR